MINTIPENATIRKELLNEESVSVCKHGPYYYAHWKDLESKKLRKRYIGDHMPKNEELNSDCNNNTNRWEEGRSSPMSR